MEQNLIPKKVRNLLKLQGVPSFIVFLLLVVGFYPLTNSLFFQSYRVGFKINYPKGMRVTESRLWKLAPIKEWGVIQGESESFIVEIGWAPIIDDITIDKNLNVTKYFLNSSYEIDYLGNSSVNGHLIDVKTYTNERTTLFENRTYYLAFTDWICIESERVFYVQFGSSSDNVIYLFEEFLEGFKCHVKTPNFP